MDEYIDIWDEGGVPSGRSALKSEAHENGWWHPTVHLWCYRSDGLVLLQRRAEDKDTFPGLWDVSAAGHVTAGESLEEAAVRELREETGIRVDRSHLESVGVFQEEHRHPGGILDREFHHTFLVRIPHPPPQMRPQRSEVSALKWIPLLKLAEETWGLARSAAYVPHKAEYYAAIVKAIRSALRSA